MHTVHTEVQRRTKYLRSVLRKTDKGQGHTYTSRARSGGGKCCEGEWLVGYGLTGDGDRDGVEEGKSKG